jgi:hypothetical protein
MLDTFFFHIFLDNYKKWHKLLDSTLHLNTVTFCDAETNSIIAKHELGISVGRMLDYDLDTNVTRVIPWEAQISFRQNV